MKNQILDIASELITHKYRSLSFKDYKKLN